MIKSRSNRFKSKPSSPPLPLTSSTGELVPFIYSYVSDAGSGSGKLPIRELWTFKVTPAVNRSTETGLADDPEGRKIIPGSIKFQYQGMADRVRYQILTASQKLVCDCFKAPDFMATQRINDLKTNLLEVDALRRVAIESGDEKGRILYSSAITALEQKVKTIQLVLGAISSGVLTDDHKRLLLEPPKTNSFKVWRSMQIY